MGEKNILFVCGGSGGHILPCVAMAEYFQQKKCHSYFLVSGKQTDKKIMEEFPYPYTTLSKLTKKTDYCTFLYKHIKQVKTLLQYLKIDVVIASGSIYSFAPLLLLSLKKYRFFLFEPNVIPGRVNSFFWRFCEKVFTGWKCDYSRAFFGNKACVTGIPIRNSLKTTYPKSKVLSELNLNSNKKTIVILGGSQGSGFLNNYVVKILLHSELKDKINIILLTADKLPEESFAGRENIKIIPFTTDTGRYYDIADLIITRAGAITLAEICYKQVPNITIPYPYSANDHQLKNAKFLQSKGLTFLVEENKFDKKYFIDMCKKLISNDNLISNMKLAMKGYFIEEAEKKIYNNIFKE